MVVDSVLEGVSSPVRSRNGPSPPFPPWVFRSGPLVRFGQPSGSHSGCREADRGSGRGTESEGRRKAGPGADGHRKASSARQDGPSGSHSGRREANRGYTMDAGVASRRGAALDRACSVEDGQPEGSHSGCREADRGSGTGTEGEGRRKVDPDHGYGADGRRKADPFRQDGPSGAHSGRREAERGYTMDSGGLWTGRLDPVEAPHAATGILRGFLPGRGSRGRCEVRGNGPNL